jgi:hypothetical protein
MILVILSLSQSVMCRAEGRKAGLDSLGIYQETTAGRQLNAPDLIANPRLFHNLSQIYVYDSKDAKDTHIESGMVKAKLTKLGVSCLDRETALKNDASWTDFEVRPGTNNSVHKCVLTITDVITIKRQPNEKYRLVWWCKHTEARSPQEGFDMLFEKLISELKSGGLFDKETQAQKRHRD